MSTTTKHGENIASQIQGEDAYGYSGELTFVDIWGIIDNIHTHFMDTDRDTAFLSRWMDEIIKMDDEEEE